MGQRVTHERPLLVDFARLNGSLLMVIIFLSYCSYELCYIILYHHSLGQSDTLQHPPTTTPSGGYYHYKMGNGYTKVVSRHWPNIIDNYVVVHLKSQNTNLYFSAYTI